MTGRPRVLLIAEAANPEWVSIPLEGWSHSRAIARLCDAHLVTQIRNRDAVLRAGLVEGRDVTFIDSERVAAVAYKLGNLLRGGKGKGWTTVMALGAVSYPYFEHLVWKQFKERLGAGEFDLVHRLTPLSPTLPSFLATKCRRAGVPFVLGPLNGGVPWPREFDAARRAEREWLSYARSAYKLLPGYRGTLRDSAAIIAGSRYTLGQFPAKHAYKTHYIPENAIDPERFTVTRQHGAGRPIKCVFVGRLVPYKGADMLIDAAADLLGAGDLTLDVIGDGPMMAPIRSQLAARGLTERQVRLLGWVKHTELQTHLSRSDLFTFPSIREFGGAVVLEAMATGVVPVVVNYGGPGELATPDSAYLIPLGAREKIVADLRATLEHCVAHPEEIDAKSAAARERARTHFTWDAKAGEVLKVYQSVLHTADRSSADRAPAAMAVPAGDR